MVLSALPLPCPALSPAFVVLYLAAGATDALDGAVARGTGTVSAFGSRLDTLADIVFVAAVPVKLLPALHAPLWLHIWVSVIALMKLANVAAGCIRGHGLVSVHSTINKVAGALLFAFPLTLPYVDLRYGATVVCVVATVAAIHEGYVAWRGHSDRTRVEGGHDEGRATTRHPQYLAPGVRARRACKGSALRNVPMGRASPQPCSDVRRASRPAVASPRRGRATPSQNLRLTATRRAGNRTSQAAHPIAARGTTLRTTLLEPPRPRLPPHLARDGRAAMADVPPWPQCTIAALSPPTRA